MDAVDLAQLMLLFLLLQAAVLTLLFVGRGRIRRWWRRRRIRRVFE